MQANPLHPDKHSRGDGGLCLTADGHGYVTMIALDALQQEAAGCNGRIELSVMPGDFVAPGDRLMRIDTSQVISDVKQSMLKNAIMLGASRSFDQDPEFCVIVMTEIANRALSSGVNDPRTAVDVVHRLSAVLLSGMSEDAHGSDAGAPRYDRIWITPLPAQRLIQSSLDVIAREGGTLPEVRAA